METLLFHVAFTGFHSMRSAYIWFTACLEYDFHVFLLQIVESRANYVNHIILELTLLMRWFLAAAFDLIVVYIFRTLSVEISIWNFYLCAQIVGGAHREIGDSLILDWNILILLLGWAGTQDFPSS